MGEARPTCHYEAGEFVFVEPLLTLHEVEPQELVVQPLLVVDEACAWVQAATERRGNPDLIEGSQRIEDLRIVDSSIERGLLSSVLPDAWLEDVLRAWLEIVQFHCRPTAEHVIPANELHSWVLSN